MSKAKVVLINPPIDTKSRSWYPIGIGYIAAVLRQKGYDVEVMDLIGETVTREQFKERLAKCGARYYGIGGILTAFNNAVDIARYVREAHPDAFIFAGNSVAYTVPELLLGNSPIDAIVLGEGEVTTGELIDALESKGDLRNVKGLMLRDGHGGYVRTEKREPIPDLDDLPFPAWDLLPIEQYFKNSKNRYCVVSTVRGCPYSCTFCCKTFIGYKTRFRSPESIMAELLAFHKKYRIMNFYFFDDLSMINKKGLLKFCEMKMASELAPVPFTVSGRVNLIDEDIVKGLKAANCSDIGFGLETADQGILDWINKGVKVEQTEKALAICDRYGMSYNGSSFMIGAEAETVETVEKTRAFCVRHNLRYEPHFMTPFPGTELYDYALKRGLIRDELDYIRRLSRQGNTNYLLVNLTKGFTDADLEALREKSLFFPKTKKPPMTWLVRDQIKTMSYYTPRELTVKVFNKLRGKSYYQGCFDRYSNDWD